MTMKDDKLVFNISARIVDTIIGDLFFRDDEVLATADSDGDNDDDMAIQSSRRPPKRPRRRPTPSNCSWRMRTTLTGTRLSSQMPCGSSLRWTTSRSACHSGKQQLPSSMSGTIPRWPRWVAWTTWSLASTSVSWSAAICRTSRTWWATCPFGPSRSHSTRAPISRSHSLIYASGSASRADSVTFIWSAFRCSLAIRQRSYIICFASSSMHSTQIGALSCSTHRRTVRTQWLGATLVSSLASHDALSSMCCLCGACRIRSTSSSSRRLKVSTAAPMSRTFIRSLFICGRNITWSSIWASSVQRKRTVGCTSVVSSTSTSSIAAWSSHTPWRSTRRSCRRTCGG